MVVNLPEEEEEHRAVDHGHREIKDQKIVSFLERELEAIFRVWRGIHFATQKGRESLPNHAQEAHVVIYDQNFLNGAVSHEWRTVRKKGALHSFLFQNKKKQQTAR